MFTRGILAGAMMAALAGSLVGPPPGPPIKRAGRLLSVKPPKATKRNAKRRKRAQHMWRV